MRQFTIPPNFLESIEKYTFRLYERMEYRGDWKSIIHMHPHTEIFFVTDGNGVFRTNEGDFPIQRGTLIINTPAVPHTELSSSRNPLSYAVFGVDNLTFTQPGSSEKTYFFDFSSRYNEIYHVLEVIEDEDVQRKPFWQQAIFNEFNDFILFLLRNTNLVTLPYDSSTKPNAISQIHDYIHAHYQENLTLESLAELCFLNKYYLAHAFKKKYGVTIFAYLNALRCEGAKRLLQSTNMSITEIAISVGYNARSHFSECYKKIMGETPAQTRKKFYQKK